MELAFAMERIAILSLFAILTSANGLRNLKLAYQWTLIDYDYPSEEARQKDIDKQLFQPDEVEPFDLDVYYKGSERKIFVTTSRYCPHIPATLSTVTNKTRNGNRVIKPYPSWEWHRDPEKCRRNSLVSVYRLFIDQCDRLWFSDNGRLGDDWLCPPRILVFDLKKDELIHTYEIPQEQHKNVSLFGTIVVEVEDPSNGCANSFAYISDYDARVLLVYDLKKNRSWTVSDYSFWPNAEYSTFNVEGKSFTTAVSVIGMALSPPGKERILYYHALSNDIEGWIYTKYLKNESLFSEPFGQSKLFHVFPHERKAQSGGEYMDSHGNLYFGILPSAAVVSWKANTDPESYQMGNFKIIDRDDETLQFPLGIKVRRNERGEEILWVFSTVLQRLISNTVLFANQTNLRVLYGKINDFRPYSTD
ncbi:major royal jelly protein 2-like [Cylas formicarius]|uniref:major royal jelly protein 2-like n=1 Tax=Cylas formicarius TaxID=197179 RepID=UPI0029588EBB|nr:major royal jelly protein 2-like [Cylas formicarius]